MPASAQAKHITARGFANPAYEFPFSVLNSASEKATPFRAKSSRDPHLFQGGYEFPGATPHAIV
jgi:hypothetical protein